MVRIGVTGGIGSGKSTFARILAGFGGVVIDSDIEAKRLMEEDQTVREALISTFGPATFQADGTLNREYLANEAFHKNRVSELNAIVHPALFKKTDVLLAAYERQGIPFAVKDAALLLRYGRPANLHHIVVITAPEAERIARVMGRDGVPEAAVRERISRQQSDVELSALADTVIQNTATPDMLAVQARSLLSRLVPHVLIPKKVAHENPGKQ